jgi:hypothetical protein
VERADQDAGTRHQGLDPLAHLAGRLVGESQGQDLVGTDSRVEEMSDASGDDSRLAGARARQDQERAFDVGHGLELCGRQISEQFHRSVNPRPQGAALDREPGFRSRSG